MADHPLAAQREALDAIDDQIIDLLGRRFVVVREVAEIKAREGIPIYVPDRAEAVKQRNADRASKHGIDPNTIRRLWGLLIDEAHVIESAVIERLTGTAPEIPKVTLADDTETDHRGS